MDCGKCSRYSGVPVQNRKTPSQGASHDVDISRAVQIFKLADLDPQFVPIEIAVEYAESAVFSEREHASLKLQVCQ